MLQAIWVLLLYQWNLVVQVTLRAVVCVQVHVIFETSCVNSKVMDDFLGLPGCQCDYWLLDFYSWLTAGMNLIVKFMLTLIFGPSDWLQLTFIFLLFLK